MYVANMQASELLGSNAVFPFDFFSLLGDDKCVTDFLHLSAKLFTDQLKVNERNSTICIILQGSIRAIFWPQFTYCW